MTAKKPVRYWIIIFVLLGFASVFIPLHHVLAQSDSAVQVRITDIDFTNFPEVILQTIVRNSNNKPVLASDLAELQLLENGAVVYSDFEQVAVGVETIYVVDFGAGMSATGSSGKSRREEVLEILGLLIENMTQEDISAILLVEYLEEVQVLHPLSGDISSLMAAIDEIPKSSNSISRGPDGIAMALQELQNSRLESTTVQSVVFISPGVQDYAAGVPVVIQQARALEISVHTVLVNLNAEPARSLQEIAAGTGGIFLHYTDIESIDQLLKWTIAQGTQTQFAFRSALSSNIERTIELRSASGVMMDTVNYQVTLKPPIVVIDEPVSNTEYRREAATYDADIERIKPTYAEIVSHVEWPDGYPRKIASAQFSVDGLSDSTSYTSPDSKTLIFIWNLRSYQEKGETPAEIRVDLKDELGFNASTVPVSVIVTVIIPQSPPSDVAADRCRAYSQDNFIARVQYLLCRIGTNAGWLVLIAVMIALLAVLIFHKPILSLINPAKTDEVGAYLRVVKGEDALLDKPIPLYLYQKTRIGQDMLQPEILPGAGHVVDVISRNHCEVVESEAEFRIRDLGSAHGTYVNAIRVPEGGTGILLEDGDNISLGPVGGGVLMIFQKADPGGLLPTTSESEAISDSSETARLRFYDKSVKGAASAAAPVDYGMDFLVSDEDNHTAVSYFEG